MDLLENRKGKKKRHSDSKDNTTATTPHPERSDAARGLNSPKKHKKKMKQLTQWKWSSSEISPEPTDVADLPSAASQPSAWAEESPSPSSGKRNQDAWGLIKAGWSSIKSEPVDQTALEGPGNTLHGNRERLIKEEILEECSNDFLEMKLAAAGLSVVSLDTRNTNHLHGKKKRRLMTEEDLEVHFDSMELVKLEDSVLPFADMQEVRHQHKSKKNTREEGKSLAEVLTMLESDNADHLAAESGQTRTQRSHNKKKRQKKMDTTTEPFMEEPFFTSGNSVNESAVAVHQVVTENETEETEGSRKHRKKKKKKEKKKEETEAAENNMKEQCLARQHDVTASETGEAGQSRKGLKKKKRDRSDATNSIVSEPFVTAKQFTSTVCDTGVADEVRNRHKKKKKTKLEEMDAVETESGTEESGGIRKHHKKKKKKKKKEETQAAEDSMEEECLARQRDVTASETGEAVQSRKRLKKKKKEGRDATNSFVIEPSLTAQQSTSTVCDTEVADDARNHHKKSKKKKKKKLEELDTVEETCLADQHFVMAIETEDMGKTRMHGKKKKKKRDMNSAAENIAEEPSLSTQGFVSAIETGETGTSGSRRKKNKRHSEKTESSDSPTAHGSSTKKTVEESKENVPADGASQAKKKKLERHSDNLPSEDFTPSQEERKRLKESGGNSPGDVFKFCPSSEAEESRKSSPFERGDETQSTTAGSSQPGKNVKSREYVSSDSDSSEDGGPPLTERDTETMRSVPNSCVYKECYICQEKVDSTKHYIKHLCKVHAKAALQCPKCGSRLLSKTLLAEHLKSSCRLKDRETAIRSFHCKICPMSYTIDVNFKRHLRSVHGLGRPIKADCEICGRAFSTARQCKQHQERCREGTIRTAVRGEGLECPQCGKLYASRQSLYYHTRMLHSHHVFECLCGKMFRTSSMYYAHKNKCVESK